MNVLEFEDAEEAFRRGTVANHLKDVRLWLSLPLRIRGRSRQTLYLRAGDDHQISEANLRSITGRIDIHIEVPRVEHQKLSDERLGESSETIRKRVQAARDIQRQRFSKDGSSNVICNANMRVARIPQFCKLDEAGESLIRAAMGQMTLPARRYHRLLKLARTIADLAGSENIQAAHLAEALHASQSSEVDRLVAQHDVMG